MEDILPGLCSLVCPFKTSKKNSPLIHLFLSSCLLTLLINLLVPSHHFWPVTLPFKPSLNSLWKLSFLIVSVLENTQMQPIYHCISPHSFSIKFKHIFPSTSLRVARREKKEGKSLDEEETCRERLSFLREGGAGMKVTERRNSVLASPGSHSRALEG